MTVSLSEARAEDRRDRRTATMITLVTSAYFAIAASMQSVFVLGVVSYSVRNQQPMPMRELAVRMAVNLTTAAVLSLLVYCAALPLRPGASVRFYVFLVIGLGLLTGLLRGCLQVLFGIYAPTDVVSMEIEFVMSSIQMSIAALAGVLWANSARHLRQVERARALARVRASEAFQELQHEETRIRKLVAQGLHGSVQSVFISFEVELDDVASAVEQRYAATEEASRVRAVARQLGELREGELRELSSLLYPIGFDRGMKAAIVAILARVPSRVAVQASYVDAVEQIERDQVDSDTALMLVRLVEEGIANALKHGNATAISLTIEYCPKRQQVEVEVDNDGLPLGDSELSGLARLRNWVELNGGVLDLVPSRGLGGVTLTASLPVA